MSTARRTVIFDANIKTYVYFYCNNNKAQLPADIRNLAIGDWDVSRVTDMSELFKNFINFNENLDRWNVSNVTNMSNMFEGCENFNKSLNGWERQGSTVGNVTDMGSMFLGCKNFNKQIDAWNVSSVTNMESMFQRCVLYDKPLNNWERQSVTLANNYVRPSSTVRNVRNMSKMFTACQEFNQNLNAWNVSGVTNMESMFRWCLNFNKNLNNWERQDSTVRNVINMSRMFTACTVFDQNLNAWNVSGVTDMSFMFLGCQIFNSSLNNWERQDSTVGNVTNMESMFKNCTMFNKPLDRWNVSNVVNMSQMFSGCESFNQSLRSWTPINVQDMSGMFNGCIRLVDPQWRISSTVDILNMFDNPQFTANLLRRRIPNRPTPPNVRQRQPPTPTSATVTATPTATPTATTATATATATTARQRTQEINFNHIEKNSDEPEHIEGLAFEIHNQFAELNFKKFVTIIKKYNDNNLEDEGGGGGGAAPVATNYKNYDAPLTPLVEYINKKKESLQREIRLLESNKNSSENKKKIDEMKNNMEELSNAGNKISKNIKRQFSVYLNEEIKRKHRNTYKNIAVEMIQFVLSQSTEFIDLYILFFVGECMSAYKGSNSMSCPGGVYERLFVSFKQLYPVLCNEANTQHLCKQNPVYEDLFNCFYPDFDLLFNIWYEKYNNETGTSIYKNDSVEFRKAKFREDVLQKFPQVDKEILNNYINNPLREIIFKTLDVNSVFGGRNRRRITHRNKLQKRKTQKLSKKYRQ